MKKYILITLYVFGVALVAAQPHYAPVLSALEAESPAFRLLQQQKEAQQAAVRSGSLVEDPEVEFAYFWRSPNDAQGNRWDLKVQQSLEMPSVYLHQSKIRRLQIETAESQWRLHRQELLLEAQQVCAALVYYNARIAFFSQCEQSAREVVELYQRRYESGECGVLEFNKAQIQWAEVRHQLNMARVERDAMMDNLTLLNGGQPLSFTDTIFAGQQLPADFEQWYKEAEQHSPQLQYLSDQLQQSEQQLSLSKAQWLPTVKVGYASETTTPEAFRGVTIGLNVPLWGKTGTVRHAQLELQAARLERENAQLRYYNHLQSLFRKAKALEENLQNLQQTFITYNSVQLQMKALDAGEITLEDYLQSMEFYHDAQMAILDAQYELETTCLELNADSL